MPMSNDSSFGCYPLKFTVGASLWTKTKNSDDPFKSPLSIFAFRLTLIFATSRILHFALKPFKQPRIVCDIAAGIILGPMLLSRIKVFRELVFPNKGATPVLDVISRFGLMYIVFLIGVKMDPGLLKRSGRKATIIGISGIVAPFLTIALSSNLLSVAKTKQDRFVYLFSVCAGNSLTSFANLAPCLSEFKLLNSEIGRTAMAASMMNDVVGWLVLLALVLGSAVRASASAFFYALCAIVSFMLFILFIARGLAMWVIERTPPGKPVREAYIFMFMLIVLVVGFLGDTIGASAFHGALMLGMAIPDGPPLGAALTEKIECAVTGILLPFFYIMAGLHVNPKSITDKNDFRFLQLLNFLGWSGKVVGTLLPSLYFKIPFNDALSLSLFMNAKGIAEVVTYNYWRTNNLINDQSYTILMLSALMVTALSTPMATTLYRPSRHYTVYKRRTVQHNKPDAELRLVACVHDQVHVPAAIHLLEALHATLDSPLSVCALHLVELVGRAAPLIIPHKMSRSESIAHHVSQSEHIINAFLLQEQRHPNLVSVNPYTTIAPYASMHDEVCHLALEKRASLILIPFHKKRIIGGAVEVNHRLRTTNHKVFLHAPCSVAVIVDLGTTDADASALSSVSGDFEYSVALFFFGGEDDREGLAIGGRMLGHPGVTLSVTRFLPSRGIKENPAERKLDNQMLDQFRREIAGLDRASYQEQLVQDMEEVVGVIRDICETKYDLLIVGMRHRVNSVVSEGGLMEWSDCPELGVVGDFLASPDFGGMFKVLVVKQQDQSGADSFLPDVEETGGGGSGQEHSPRSAAAPGRTSTLNRQIEY